MNMPTTEQFINNKLQQVIACNAVEHSALTSAQAVVLMTSYLIERRSRNTTEQQEIDSFLKVLYPECLRPKNKMQELSSLGFNDRCSTLWDYISKIDQPELKKRIENLQLPLIISIEDAGYLSFGKNLESFANARGNESYIWMDIRNSDLKNEGETSVSSTQPVDLEESTLQTEHSVSTTQENASVSNTTHQNSVGGVSAYRVSKVDNGEELNKPFVQLYQTLLNSQPNGEAPKYVWQWLLSQQQYDDIKSCFNTNNTNGLLLPSVIKPNTAKLLCLYIGEFYKREYDGSNKHPVLSKSKSRDALLGKLCEYQTIKPYQKVNNTNMFTLYVSGGLPIHYLANHNNQYQTLVRALVRLLDPDSDDFEKEIGKQLLSRVSNTALRESYIQKHSIYEYIARVQHNGQVWDKNDNLAPDFQKMSHFVRDYKNKLDERFREKFRTKYSLWIDSAQSVPETIRPTICLYPEEDGERHYALSRQRLNALGISAPDNEFELCVKDGTNILTSLHFSLCCNGDYIADDLQQTIPLGAISIVDLPQKVYNIEYQDTTGQNSRLKSVDLLPKWGYLQFYTGDDPQNGASYVTPKGSAAFRSSAVLYDSDKWKVESVDYESNDTSIPIPNSSLRWVLFKQCITLVSVKSGKTKSLYNTQGRFYAIPKQASYSNFDAATSPIISNENHCYSCQLQNKTENGVHLVKDTHIEFDLYKASDGAELKDMKADIAYRYSNSDIADWMHYDPKTPLPQGYVQFRILLGTFESIVECFVLACDAKMIQEKNGNMYRYRISKVTNVVSCHNGFIFNNLNGDIVGSGTNKKDNIDFSIGSTNGSGARLRLSAYNPQPTVVVTDTNGNPVAGELIVTWAERYAVKSINSGVYSLQNLSVDGTYNFLMQVLTANIQHNVYKPQQPKDLNHIDSQIMLNQRSIKVYTNLFSDNIDTAGMSFYVLDFQNNTLTAVQGNNSVDVWNNAKSLVQSKKMQAGGLLFQSLKGAWLTGTYFKSEYIPYGQQQSATNPQVDPLRTKYKISGNQTTASTSFKGGRRTSRLTNYEKAKKYLTAEAYAQFEIACEHRLYFAELDCLLSMCWSAKNKNLQGLTPKRIYDFLVDYVQYCDNLNKDCDIAGLLRLSREFQFDWRNIKQKIEKATGLPITTKLQNTYKELI